jgi:hypothetical protein
MDELTDEDMQHLYHNGTRYVYDPDRKTRKNGVHVGPEALRRIQEPADTTHVPKIQKLVRSVKLRRRQAASAARNPLYHLFLQHEITHIFNGFTDFRHVLGIHQGHQDGNSGFVREIEYERMGYRATALLKSSKHENSDNLVYEYLVGKHFINHVASRFPCFVRTYGLYFYDGHKSWNRMKNAPTQRNLEHLVLQDAIRYDMACARARYAAILIQHLPAAVELRSMLVEPVVTFTPFWKNDLLYVLFIVYQALAALSPVFTHYDLHSSNILLYRVDPIHYVYEQADGTELSFSLPYVVKIIDYGRSFFDNGRLNSAQILADVCAAPSCGDCGKTQGFQYLNAPADPSLRNYLISSQNNASHDLRLMKQVQTHMVRLNYLEKAFPQEETFKQLRKIVNKMKTAAMGNKQDLRVTGAHIYNVNGAYEALKTAVSALAAENAANYPTQIGTLRVRIEEPMTFVLN